MATPKGDGSIILSTKIDETGLKKGLSSIQKTAKTMFAVVGAAATAATVAITKQAVTAFADYQQLVGGVETLFKKSSGKILEYASQAYATAGISANEYMQSVTNFAASLISSTAGDTDKAADIANTALMDMSDNANKMGSSLESITLAYQGFAKQQYQLLDNLKLGYGGTKAEMERLLKHAEEITGVKYDINNLADVYSAIHEIQKELEITGTTALEAEKTISGSAAMTKASWQNVLTAIAGGGDLDRAINALVHSIGRYFANIMPVVESALLGVGKAIEKLAPEIVQSVAKALIKAIPSLVNAVYQMILGLAKGIYEGIIALFSGGDVSSTIVESAEQQADAIKPAIDNQKGMTEAVEETAEAQKKVLAGFDDIQILSGGAKEEAEPANINMNTDIGGIMDGGQMLPATEADAGVFQTISNILKKVFDQLKQISDLFMNGFWREFEIADFSSVESALSNILDIAKSLAPSFSSFASSIALSFGSIVGSIGTVATSIGNSLFTGIDRFVSQNGKDITTKISGLFNIAKETASIVSGIFSSLSKAVRKAVRGNDGKMISSMLKSVFDISTSAAELAGNTINTILGGVQNVLNGRGADISNALGSLFNSAGEMSTEASKIWTSLVGALNGAITSDSASSIVESIASMLVTGGTAIAEVGGQLGADLVTSFSTIITDNEEQLGLALQSVVDAVAAITAPITALVEGMFNEIVELYNESLGPFIETFAEGFSNMFGAVLEAYNTYIAPVLQTLGEAFNSLVQNHLAPMFEKIFGFFGKAMELLKTLFTTFVVPIFEWVVDTVVPIIAPAIEFIGTVFFSVVGIISDGVGTIFEILGGLVDFVVNVFTGEWKAAWNAIKGIWSSFKDFFGAVWDGIKEIFSGVGKFFYDTFSAAWSGIVSVFSPIGEVFVAIKDGVVTVFKTVVNGLITGINMVVGAPFKGLNKILDSIQGISIIGIEPFGWLTWRAPVPEIPKLAAGAVIPPNREFLAVLGDQKQGTNIEAPAELIKQMVKEALNERQYENSSEVVLVLDGTELGRAVVKYGDRERRREGTKMVVMA